MADSDLRRRLSAATFIALDESVMDQIHDRLMAGEVGTKVPVTVKFDFVKGEEDEIVVSTTCKTTLPLTPIRLRLESDGKQLSMFEPPAATPKPPTVAARARAAAAEYEEEWMADQDD